MKIDFSSQRREMLLFLTTNMAAVTSRANQQYRKIPKISPGAYIFQRPFLTGLFLEGLMYGGKFGCQNRLG